MTDVAEKIFCIILSIGMLVHAYAVSRFARSWLLPACIYSIAWFLFSFIPLIVAPSAPANPLAVGYILLTCIAFSAGAYMHDWRKFTVQKPIVGAGDVYDTIFLRAAFVGFSILAILAVIANTLIQGVSLKDFTSDFFTTSNSLIARRYSDTLINSIFTQISNVACYVAVSLGGLILSGFRTIKSRILVIIISMLPSLIVMAALGAKGMIFLCIAFFYAGTLIRSMLRGDHRLTNRKSLIRGAFWGILLLPFITLSFLSRGLYRAADSTAVTDKLLSYYISYSSGHLYAFSDWFTWLIGQKSLQYYYADEISGGFYTFMSLFLALGSKKVVPPGVYQEYYSYGGYLGTNIYTHFRGVITDFSIPGSIVFFFIVGVICHWIFFLVMRKKDSYMGICFYIMMMGYIYTSFIISLLVWNSTYAAFITLWLTLFLNGTLFRGNRSGATKVDAP